MIKLAGETAVLVLLEGNHYTVFHIEVAQGARILFAKLVLAQIAKLASLEDPVSLAKNSTAHTVDVGEQVGH